ncbi:MAG: sel1 repeat family protein [Bacteroidales bacterium]|nr:sel1 repeat family protein [Bacteroidales bacterium]
MSKIKCCLAKFLRRIGNRLLKLSIKIDYSQGLKEEIIMKDEVSSNTNDDETFNKKVEKKRKSRKLFRKIFVILGILVGVFVLYIVGMEIYLKKIWPKQAEAEHECLLEEARIHPEKAGEIAIEFKRHSCDHILPDFYRNDHVHYDPLFIIRGECKFDHYTAYTTALNLYAQYVKDSLKNNSKVFYALSNFKETHKNELDEEIDILINRFFRMWGIDAAKGDVQSQCTLACEYERLGRIEMHRNVYIGNEVYIQKYYDVLCQEKAAYWYLQAAEQGMSDAMVQLANCYKEGFGVDKSLAKAKEWYEKAAIAGNGEGMINLGDIYRDGIVAGRDIALAKYWWEKASSTEWRQESENRLQKIYN